ncbi:guanylate kinase [Brucella pseudogrignonensis]|jgi:guanylate kinase|uniref:guanylate kinase n=1 Tax=Brucella/Ochrobactrum group TaxID=2826938 RepID=UPI000DE420A1|nr:MULTISPECIES: guanylate kinase [Brucella]MBK0020455.1 guanylate kinase [Ochrobactrum sp. S45]MBK0042805.1 guanylate kinase [Ochrobactrum sp. S46]QWK78110.1 guanylate kinase [Ochrobactrum sp. BTU1]KAB2691120.1 guanylate kinase [Brucella pseudogrignonensis]MCD4510998.1 guanylate kinase [Brucella pseudogrignonensis]
MAISSVENGIARRGLMVVISSPSGAGKSTIARQLLGDPDMKLSLSISVTTRERRPSEIDGVHYHFITKREFERLRDNDELIEWAEVHGNFYGTLRQTAEEALADGQDMLFDIDWQGAEQLQAKMPADVVSIFILPPTMRELQNRLNRRAEDTADVIETRLQNARFEIQKWVKYDYIVINEDLQRSYAGIKGIIVAERLRRDRRPGLFEFVEGLLEENPGI